MPVAVLWGDEMGCLYRITMPCEMAYIGITSKTCLERMKVHMYEANRGTRGRLYNAIRKHGIDAAKVEVLVIADDWGYLCDMEVRAISVFKTRSPHGLNMTDGGDGASPGSAHHAGFRHSDEAKAKMSAAKFGKRHSQESREKISAALAGNKRNLGRTASADTKAKLSTSHLGQKRTPEQRANISSAAIAREALKREQRGT